MIRYVTATLATVLGCLFALTASSTPCHAAGLSSSPTAPAAPQTAIKVNFVPEATWSPDDNAAQSFGKIRTAPGRLSLGDQDFALQHVQSFGTRGNADVATLFSTDASGGARSALFRVNIPADTRIKGNSVCGSADVTWAVILIDGNEMHLGLFSGSSRPDLNPKLIRNSHTVCATVSFSRKQ